MKKYETIGELLKDLRTEEKITQSNMASILNLTSRTLGRIERDEVQRLNKKSKHLLTENLKVPPQVVSNLSSEIKIPTYYSIATRRYSLSKLYLRLNQANLDYAYAGNVIGDGFSISSNMDVDDIHEYDNHIYPTENPIQKSVILKSAEVLPELNLIYRDDNYYYGGHVVVIPLSEDCYSQIRVNLKNEGKIETTDLMQPSERLPILYVYSCYANCCDISILLIKKAFNGLKHLVRSGRVSKRSILAGYAVTNDGIDMAENAGLEKIFEAPEEFIEYGTQQTPSFYENRIANTRISKYL
ncbi:helix-turn-helix domain-containing protein [Ekhidna sp.]|uniref:helix-turn-helix domain-containing protein n=1 Tax=Ekhidna sp. TaxID=2608089 RepID=UPI0032EF657D